MLVKSLRGEPFIQQMPEIKKFPQSMQWFVLRHFEFWQRPNPFTFTHSHNWVLLVEWEKNYIFFVTMGSPLDERLIQCFLQELVIKTVIFTKKTSTGDHPHPTGLGRKKWMKPKSPTITRFHICRGSVINDLTASRATILIFFPFRRL